MKKSLIIFLATSILTVAQAFSQCSVNLQITNALCANSCDGVITATPSGGTPPYTYSWDPFGDTTQTVTGLCPGWPNYTVTVTDNSGCTTTASATVNSPPSIYMTKYSAFSCITNTGTASVTVSGGIPPYTYNWNPSGQTTQIATGLNAGTYTITVTDSNACSSTSTVAVAPIDATINVNRLSACTGMPFFFNNQSIGNPLQWHWTFGDGYTSNIKNPWHNYQNPGAYLVTLVVTNGFGCQDSNQITLLNNPIPTPNYSAPIVCAVSPTCFTNLSSIAWGTIVTWNWNFGDSASGSNTSNLQNPCHTYTSIGAYTISLEIISDSGCQSHLIAGQGAIVDSCLDIPTLSGNRSVDISPNPFHTSAILRTNGTGRKLKIYNSFGVFVRQEIINNQLTIINRNSLADGIYFFQLISTDGQTLRGKFVVE